MVQPSRTGWLVVGAVGALGVALAAQAGLGALGVHHWLFELFGVVAIVGSAAVVVTVGVRAWRAEQAAADQLALLGSFVDVTSDLILLLEESGEMLLLNPSARAFGVGAREGLPWDSFRGRDASTMAASGRAFAAALRGEEGRFVVWLDAGAGPRPFEFRMGSVRDRRGRTRVLAVGSDITVRQRELDERRTLEAQVARAQRLDSLGRLAGGVAHDFNNLLTVILGQSSVLHASEPDASRRADLQAITDASQRAAALVRQLLAFGRRHATDPRRVDVRDVVSAALPLLGRLLGEGVRLVVDLDEGAAVTWADPGQLEQVLVNLVVNALDATRGEGEIEIRVRAVDDGWIELSVRDDGEGLTDEVRERLFEPFFTTKEFGRGAGLGLSVVHGIVTRAGGRVDVASVPARGSTFTIRLPRAPREHGDAGRSRARPVTVLLVEGSGGETRSVLEQLGHRVIAADSATARDVMLARRGEVALVVVDLVLPVTSGIVLARELSAAREPPAPVALLSAYSDPGEPLDLPAPCRRLPKPPPREELDRAIAELVGS